MKRDLDLAELARAILMAPLAKPAPCTCDRYSFPHRATVECQHAQWDAEMEADTGDDTAELRAQDEAMRARDMNKAGR